MGKNEGEKNHHNKIHNVLELKTEQTIRSGSTTGKPCAMEAEA